MKLGFHYHIPAYIKDGSILTMALQGLFIDHLAVHCEQVVLFLYKPLDEEMESMDYPIKSGNVKLVSLVPHYSVPVRLLLSPLMRNKVRKHLHEIDILFVRAPTPLLPFIAADALRKIPVAFLVVGEMSDHIDNIPQKWWRKPLLRKYILWNERRQKELAVKATVFANSQVVFDKYKIFAARTRLIFTTTLTRSDFFKREDTCQGPLIELLFTGRIDQGKGILELAEAVCMLNKEGINCRLNIVGWATPKDPTPTLISDVATRGGYPDRVLFHGKKKVGKELFDFYRKADIFILPSQVAEGFPRTIWEALANSLPVIATPVGSIPYFLKENISVLLVNQHDPVDISRKIRRVVEDRELRMKLIANGFQAAEQATLEIQAKKIYEGLKEAI